MRITKIEEEYMGRDAIIYCMDKSSNSGSMTTYQYCPKCDTGELYRVYYPYNECETKYSIIAIYEAQCPHCNKRFDIVDYVDK